MNYDSTARPPAGELTETIEALRAQLSEARSDAREEYARAEAAEQALVAARADVARLTAECADWGRLHNQTARLCARCSTVLETR